MKEKDVGNYVNLQLELFVCLDFTKKQSKYKKAKCNSIYSYILNRGSGKNNAM